MKDDNKRIAKNSLIIYLRLIISTVFGLVYARFFFRALGADDYGLYNVVGSIVSMMMFVNTIMVTTTYRFMAFEMGKETKGDVNRVFNISLLIHFLLAIVVLLISLTVGQYYIEHYLNVDSSKLQDVYFVFRVSIISCAISVLCVPYQGFITATENFGTIAGIQIINSLLLLCGSIVLSYYIGNRLRMYAIIMASLSIFMSLQYVAYCFIKYRITTKIKYYKDRNLFLKMLRFSGWTAIGAAAWVGQRQGSSIIINYFFGAKLNAAYGISLTFHSLISQFAKAISQSAAPQITKSFSGDDVIRSVNLASYISKYVVFLILLFSVPILLETDFLLDIWLGHDMVPEYTTIMCQLMIVNLIFDGMGEGLNALVQAIGKIKWFQIALGGLQLFSLVVGCVLYSNGNSPISLFYCFIGASILIVIVRQLLLNKLVDFNVRLLVKRTYIKIIWVMICLVPLFIISSLFKDGFYRFIIVVPCSIFYTLITIWIVGIDNSEKNVIKKLIKTKISL